MILVLKCHRPRLIWCPVMLQSIQNCMQTSIQQNQPKMVPNIFVKCRVDSNYVYCITESDDEAVSYNKLKEKFIDQCTKEAHIMLLDANNEAAKFFITSYLTSHVKLDPASVVKSERIRSQLIEEIVGETLK